MLIAKYSALMEPVVNVLQSVALDVVKASEYVKRILLLIKNYRENPEKVTDEIIKEATAVAEKVELEEDITSMLRITGKQRHRSNHPAESTSEYWKRFLVIPYLDSIITSLEVRFAEENTPSFVLSKLHRAQMQKMTTENLKPTFIDVLKEKSSVFPETEKALKILIVLPCTTCTVERSFSSLRRLKTWLRSAMSEDRLNGLAMMSVHRAIINKNLNNFNDKVVESFSKNLRRLCFN
ncbi:unnamed protein product [Euphydryas editha]|uniref:HAT C-terminal dimerisation domain-containing protein n=1 Tax=Euphydryas editha TaxID=104508 RepID=A0AAU9UVG6_EUPED|nr:unnamed protein product [Euphydryas editha]